MIYISCPFYTFFKVKVKQIEPFRSYVLGFLYIRGVKYATTRKGRVPVVTKSLYYEENISRPV